MEEGGVRMSLPKLGSLESGGAYSLSWSTSKAKGGQLTSPPSSGNSADFSFPKMSSSNGFSSNSSANQVTQKDSSMVLIKDVSLEHVAIV